MPHHAQEIQLWTRLFEIRGEHVSPVHRDRVTLIAARLHGLLDADEKLTAVDLIRLNGRWLRVSDEVGNVNPGVASVAGPREESTERIRVEQVQYLLLF